MNALNVGAPVLCYTGNHIQANQMGLNNLEAK